MELISCCRLTWQPMQAGTAIGPHIQVREGRQRQTLKAPGHAGGDQVIRESSIATEIGVELFRHLDVGQIFAGMPMHRYRRSNRKREAAIIHREPWFD